MDRTEYAEAVDSANDVVLAFNAKTEQVAAQNGWTVAHAKTVMFAFLQDNDPETAKTIAIAMAVR